MFKMSPPAIKSSFIAVTLALSAFSLSAHATLTSYTVNGTDLVYSSVSDVTWTKDANLLSTWIGTSSDNDSNGTLDIIDAIIAASPTISNTPNFYDGYTGTYSLSSSDFSSDGKVSWFGAMALLK